MRERHDVKVLGVSSKKKMEREHSMEDSKSKYHKEVKLGVFVDVYDVLNAYEVTDPATQHAIKKLLMPGQRGHKDGLKDLQEAKMSIERAIVTEEERVERLSKE